MDKYYYFMSQMAFLQFGHELQITRRYFIEEARKWLCKNDYQNMIRANINEYEIIDDSSSGLLRNYSYFEYRLRYELAIWRKAKKEGHEYKSIMFPPSLVKDGNPLEVETNLIRFRWEFIEEQEIGHYFDLDAVIAYYLKLQLLERLFSFDKTEGKEKFKKLSSIPDKNGG